MSKRDEMHAWFAARQQAKAGDLEAAARYEELAQRAASDGNPEQASYRHQQAQDARASAAAWDAEMSARMAGKWRERRPKRGTS